MSSPYVLVGQLLHHAAPHLERGFAAPLAHHDTERTLAFAVIVCCLMLLSAGGRHVLSMARCSLVHLAEKMCNALSTLLTVWQADDKVCATCKFTSDAEPRDKRAVDHWLVSVDNTGWCRYRSKIQLLMQPNQYPDIQHI
jgi:hypothetical protein